MSRQPLSESVDLQTATWIVQTLIDVAPRFKSPGTPEKFKEVVEHWQRSLNAAQVSYHSSIYKDAVYSWLSAATADTWYPAPGDILAHCAKSMDRIDRDPVRGPKMREWKENRRMERINAMAGDSDE